MEFLQTYWLRIAAFAVGASGILVFMFWGQIAPLFKRVPSIATASTNHADALSEAAQYFAAKGDMESAKAASDLMLKASQHEGAS